MTLMAGVAGLKRIIPAVGIIRIVPMIPFSTRAGLV
jgi:hypothetical protein